jgi:hypothetical protein
MLPSLRFLVLRGFGVVLVALSGAAAPAAAQFPLPGGGGDMGPARFGLVAGVPTSPGQTGFAVGGLVTFGGAAVRGRRGGLGARIEAQYLRLERPSTGAAGATPRDTLTGVALLAGSELGGRIGDDYLVYANFGTGFGQFRERGPGPGADAAGATGLVLSLGFGVRAWNWVFAEWGLLTVRGSAPLLLRAGILF